MVGWTIDCIELDFVSFHIVVNDASDDENDGDDRDDDEDDDGGRIRDDARSCWEDGGRDDERRGRGARRERRGRGTDDDYDGQRDVRTIGV